MTTVFYIADDIIRGSPSIFSYDTYEKATLYVSKGGVVLSGYLDPWKNFKNVKVYDSNGVDNVIVDFDEDIPYEIYNLNGVKICDSLEDIAPGLYIVRRSDIVKKISVK